MKATRVLYVDLDGTVRKGFDELGHFVNCVADVAVFPEAATLLAAYKKAGWRIAAVSNQGGIALGHLSQAECAAIMFETNKQCGGVFDKIAWCSHHPNATDPEMARCWCRKPRAGLIWECASSLAQKHDEYYPPHLALMVGDRPEDEGCAQAADVDFMRAQDWRAMDPNAIDTLRRLT